MNHPDELLAEYVDGTLTERALDEVRDHLAVCGRCRAEVEMAQAGRLAMSSLAQATVPEGLLADVIEEATREAKQGTPEVVPMRSKRTPGVPAWYRWAGAAGVAAAAVLVVAIALPNLGGRDTGGITTAEGSQDRGAPGGPVQLEVQDADYDEAGIQQLLAPYGADVAPGNGTAAPQFTEGDAGVETEGTTQALDCLTRAFTRPDGGSLIEGELVRLISARFQGKPAYIGIYLTGPGAGEPHDRANVWIASAEDCSVLSATQATL